MKSLAVITLAIAMFGCTKTTAATEEPATVSAQVARIVFVGEQNACACTQERMELTWTALQEALGEPPRLPVERVDVGTDAAVPYQEMQAVMVIPGLYFLDASGALVGMLQGELTSREIANLLGR